MLPLCSCCFVVVQHSTLQEALNNSSRWIRAHEHLPQSGPGDFKLSKCRAVNAADVNWFYPALYCNKLRILWVAYPPKMPLQKWLNIWDILCLLNWEWQSLLPICFQLYLLISFALDYWPRARRRGVILFSRTHLGQWWGLGWCDTISYQSFESRLVS